MQDRLILMQGAVALLRNELSFSYWRSVILSCSITPHGVSQESSSQAPITFIWHPFGYTEDPKSVTLIRIFSYVSGNVQIQNCQWICGKVLQRFSSVLNMEDLLLCSSFFFNSVGNKENYLTCFSVHFTYHLTDFRLPTVPTPVPKSPKWNLQGFQLKFCTSFLSLRCALNSPPLPIYLYLEQTTNCNYIFTVHFYALLKISPGYMQIFFSVHCFTTPLTCVIIITL
jgi:hypothetical protein